MLCRHALILIVFPFLPITDRRTVRMRLCMLCALLALSRLRPRTHSHRCNSRAWARPISAPVSFSDHTQEPTALANILMQGLRRPGWRALAPGV